MHTKSIRYIKLNALVLIGILLTSKLISQKQNSNWYFGNKAAISFTNNSVSVINTSSLIGGEGTASISDSLGNLLFYTNGIRIYNRLNNLMLNGDSLNGNPSSSQSSLICPKPCSSNIYYVFTNDALENENINGLCYSEVNMNLGNGNGAVTSNKNINLVSPTAEKLTGVLHSNAKDYWVVTHGKGNTNFYSFLVTASGVNTTAVVSASVGNLVDSSLIVGQMKISFNGQKLALGYLGGFAELFDFNPATGIVSNPILIPDSGIYGVEFSKSGRFLYLSDNYKREIYQYDLNASNILLSKITIGSIPIPNTTAGLQLAPNGKIYGAVPILTSLTVINFPDLQGAACSFTPNGQPLGSNTGQAGLPNFFLKYTAAGKCNEFTNLNENNDKLTRFVIFPNPAEDTFYIKIDNAKSTKSISLSNAAGTLAKKSVPYEFIDVDLIQVNISDLTSGTYFVTLKLSEGITLWQKLIIR